MESEICKKRSIEKQINIFCINFSECKYCTGKRGIKRYSEKTDNLSNQRKIYFRENEETLLQKQNDRYIRLKS